MICSFSINFYRREFRRNLRYFSEESSRKFLFKKIASKLIFGFIDKLYIERLYFFFEISTFCESIHSHRELVGFYRLFEIGDKFRGLFCRHKQKTRSERVERTSVSDFIYSETSADFFQGKKACNAFWLIHQIEHSFPGQLRVSQE